MPLLSQIKDTISNSGKELSRILKKFKYRWREYDLWKEIHNNPWLKKSNPYAEAKQWYIKEIARDSEHHIKRQFLMPGKLYMFNYDDPKYKNILPWFDTQPLVIGLGPIRTSEGIRVLGLNMHLLPPTIRRIVMVKIFEMNKALYKAELFEKNQKPVLIKWKALVAPLEKYGIEFCIRMYIPELQKNVVEFRYDEWYKAIYIESKGMSKISFEALRVEWANFVHKSKNKALKENWEKA